MAAKTLEARKTPEGKVRYWTKVWAEMVAELHRHGIDDSTAARELDAFHAAVSSELSRIALDDSRDMS